MIAEASSQCINCRHRLSIRKVKRKKKKKEKKRKGRIFQRKLAKGL